ncbi:MAG: tetratricopeptide repeat protein [Desulfuromonadales bacterium]|nr:tetratricopeptide repeat protein [Desulfuromonadales bacterium]
MSKDDRHVAVPHREELQTIYDMRRPAYDGALTETYREVRSLLERYGYTPTIKYRVKRFNNYYGKLKKVLKDGKEGSEGQITDLLGLRIICPFLEDLEIIEGLLTEHFPIVESERKGERNSFREFSYDSVHLLLSLDPSAIAEPIPHCGAVCEIQLRTILQDAWAEVEHELVYKSDIVLPNESIKRKLASLNATLTLSDLIFQEIRDYQKEIRHHGRKRRESIEEILRVQDLITLPSQQPMEPPSTMQVGPISYAMANELEKIMLSALNAHSHNELETAVQLYGRLLEMDLEKPIRAMVYNHRGMAYFSLGNLKQASKDFSRSIEYDGASFRSRANRGLANRMLRKFDASLDDYNRALEIDAANHEGYFGRAQTFYDLQLFSKALADCEKALDLQPEYSPARTLRELIHRVLFAFNNKAEPPGD